MNRMSRPRWALCASVGLLTAVGPVFAADEPVPAAPDAAGRPAAGEEAERQLRRDATREAERSARSAEREHRTSTAWLGVQLSPVPAALAAHLKLSGGGGLMVQNVHKDSPADKAGLQQYDVIVSYDGDPLGGDITDFQDRVRARKPGEVIRLEVRRAGETKSVEVTVGEMPRPSRRLEWRYQDDPDVTSRNLYGLRGRILRPGPNGWEMEDLGDLFEDWGERFEDEFEGAPPAVEEAPLAEARRVDREGNVLHVRRDGERVVVRRFKSGTPEEQTEAKEYEGLDQLREQDREAFDLLQRPRRLDDQSYRQALREYLRNLPRTMPRAPLFNVPAPNYPRPPFVPQPPTQPRVFRVPRPVQPNNPDGFNPAPPREDLRVPAEPRKDVSFELLPDGSIKAEVREGGDSLSATFSSEADMKEKAPKLFERWRALKNRLR